MKLTDNEKREILKLIEAGKPLPDKYRFLSFDDKREEETPLYECSQGRHKVAVKAVDISGNDTMKIEEVSM